MRRISRGALWRSLFILGALLGALMGAVFANPAVVNTSTCSGTGTGTNFVCSITATSAGNVLVISVAGAANCTLGLSIGVFVDQTNCGGGAWATPSAGTTSITITSTATNNKMGAVVKELSGVTGTSPVDGNTAGSFAGGATCTTSSLTPSVTHDAVVFWNFSNNLTNTGVYTTSPSTTTTEDQVATPSGEGAIMGLTADYNSTAAIAGSVTQTGMTGHICGLFLMKSGSGGGGGGTTFPVLPNAGALPGGMPQAYRRDPIFEMLARGVVA